MGLIHIIKPVQSSAVIKSQQHQEKNSLKRRESNPGLLSAKREHYTFVLSAHSEIILLQMHLRARKTFLIPALDRQKIFRQNFFQMIDCLVRKPKLVAKVFFHNGGVLRFCDKEAINLQNKLKTTNNPKAAL